VCDPLQGADDPSAVRVTCLTVVALVPGKALVDLLAGQTGPGTNVDLAEAPVRDHRNAVRLGNDQSCLVCPAQVARVHGVERIVGEARRKLLGLSAPALVERRIGPTLEAPVAVPVRLAVPRQEDRGHGD